MNERRCGIMINEIPFGNFPILLGQAGMDFILIDCEHGGFDYREVYTMTSASKAFGKTETIIRLSSNRRRDIIKFLDMGADSLLLPMTNGADDIKEVVRYAKYSPLGERGISTMRAHTLYDPPVLTEYMRTANEHTKVYAQIETVSGVEHIEEILATEGVAGFFLGPNDLSDSYHCLTDPAAPEILSAIEKTAEAARKLNKLSGIITANEAYLIQAKRCGVKMFCKGSELSVLKSGAKKIVKELLEN